MRIDVKVVNAFVDQGRGGNPAALVLEADGLTAAQKQRAAARIGLSETAFVSASAVADVKLEFFTPTRQIAHCGHATIAAFACLRERGRIAGPASSKETVDGRREIFLEDDLVFMEQRAPRYRELGNRVGEALGSLRLAEADLLPGQTPVVVDTGNGFLIVPLAGEAGVAAAVPDPGRVAALSEAFDLVGFYLVSRQTRVPGRDAGARMFAPRYGIPEEAATGMAAGPLAAWLHDRLGSARETYRIEQGHLMQPPSPSLIEVRLIRESGRIQRLLAGGRALPVRTLQIDV
jgi:PhzF family phenazine biosynthesis protein